MSSTDHRGLKITTTRLSVNGTERRQTRVNWREEQMVVISDLQGNKITVSGNIQFDSKVENVWEVCSDNVVQTKNRNLNFQKLLVQFQVLNFPIFVGKIIKTLSQFCWPHCTAHYRRVSPGVRVVR